MINGDLKDCINESAELFWRRRKPVKCDLPITKHQTDVLRTSVSADLDFDSWRTVFITLLESVEDVKEANVYNTNTNNSDTAPG